MKKVSIGMIGGGFAARLHGNSFRQVSGFEVVLRGVAGQFPRTCRFQCAIVCCFPNGEELSANGTCEGTVAFTPMGTDGFGYDPIFFVPRLKKTFAQLSPEEKNAISHRGNALRDFAQKLKDYLNA